MANFIEELYYGNIDPQTRGTLTLQRATANTAVKK